MPVSKRQLVNPANISTVSNAVEELRDEERAILTAYCFLNGMKTHELVKKLLKKFLKESPQIANLRKIKEGKDIEAKK